MKKSEKDKINRLAFIRMTIDNPENAVRYLNEQMKVFKKCKGTSETVKALSELLFLSEQTIYKDYSK